MKAFRSLLITYFKMDIVHIIVYRLLHIFVYGFYCIFPDSVQFVLFNNVFEAEILATVYLTLSDLCLYICFRFNNK